MKKRKLFVSSLLSTRTALTPGTIALANENDNTAVNLGFISANKRETVFPI